MSEFQYFAWSTLNRRLSAQQQQEVNKLSSHIDVTPTGAEVTYEWGNFKHDPIQVLARYFDAFMYYTNWGTRQVALRFPRKLIGAEQFAPYLWDEFVELLEEGDSYILIVGIGLDGAEDWYDFDAPLDTLGPLRDAILNGDHRALYLAWMVGICEAGGRHMDELDEELAPPLPAGLGQLTPELEAFVDFFALDPYLVDAAAKKSGKLRATDPGELRANIARLSRAECDDFLVRLAQDDPQLRFDFQLRLRELAPPATSEATAAPTRQTWGELRRAAEKMREAELAAQRAAAEKRRLKELQELAAKEPEIWRTVDRLVDEQKASSYAQAVELLRKLRALAVHENRLPGFQARVEAIKARQGKRTALVSRMREAGLL
jgi:hypothetical protein